MRLQRLFGSFFNYIFSWLAPFLWIFNVNPIGSLIFQTACPDTRRGKLLFLFGVILADIVSIFTLGILTFILWLTNKDSLAVRFTKFFWQNAFNNHK